MSALADRLDKWLWRARVTKTRTMASRLIIGGKVRVNRKRVNKAAHSVKPGDVITAALRGRVRVLRIEAVGARRGPAAEAALLFTDLTPESAAPAAVRNYDTLVAARLPGSGRPTKRQRRALEKFLTRHAQ